MLWGFFVFLILANDYFSRKTIMTPFHRLTKRFVIILLLSSCFLAYNKQTPAQTGYEIEKIGRYYNHANTYYWYGRERSNNLFEFLNSQAYLDSVNMILDRLDSLDPDVRVFRDSVKAEVSDFYQTIDAMVDVCIENANGRIPMYHGFTDDNNDYELIDDVQETGIELALDRILAKPFPFKPVGEQVYYTVIQIDPYDRVHEEVIHQFVSSNSSHYVISRHELNKILPDSLFEVFNTGVVDENILSRIARHYNTDKIGIISVRLNDAVDGIYYYGASFTNYDAVNNEIGINVYTEAFRHDKTAVIMKALLYGLLTLLAILLIIPLSCLMIRDGTCKYSVMIGSISILLSFLIASLSGIILNTIAPNPMTFYHEFPYILWRIVFSICLIILPLFASYFILIRFFKEKLHHQQGIFALLTGNVAGFFYILVFESYMLFESAHFFRIVLILFPAVLLINYLLSKFFLDYFFKTRPVYLVSALIILIALVIVPYLSIEHYTVSDTLNDLLIVAFPVLIGAVLPAISTLDINRIRKTKETREFEIDTKEGLIKYLSEPEYINPFPEKMLDVEETLFSNPGEQITINIISGTRGLGKSRYFKELTIQLKEIYGKDLVVLFGECQQFDENNIPYKPFIEAFENQMGKGRFMSEDRFGKLLGDSISKSGLLELGPLAMVSPLLESNGESSMASAPEIAGDLNLVFQKMIHQKKKIILAFDDVQWMDDASMELNQLVLDNIIKNGMSESIAVINIFRNHYPGQSDEQILQEKPFDQINSGSLHNKINFRFLTRESDLLPEKFLEDLLGSIKRLVGINYQTEGKLLRYFNRIGLSNPTYYLQSLINFVDKNILRIEGGQLHMPEDIKIEELPIPGDLRKLYRERFSKINPELLRILESAAFVGECFEAAILAEIWQISNKLELLYLLKEAQDLNIIFDKSDQDDVYCFTSKSIMTELRCLNSDSDIGEEGIEIPQIIKEYHKRIVTSFEKIKAKDLHEMDLDLIYSIANRTFINREVSADKAYTYNKLAADQSMKRGMLENAMKYYGKVLKVTKIYEESREETAGLRLALMQAYLDLEDIFNPEFEALLQDDLYSFSPGIYSEYLIKMILVAGRKRKFDSIPEILDILDGIDKQYISRSNLLRIEFYRIYYLGNLSSEEGARTMANALQELLLTFPREPGRETNEVKSEILNTLGGALLGDRLRDPGSIMYLDKRMALFLGKDNSDARLSEQERLDLLNKVVASFGDMELHDKKGLCFTLNYYGRAFHYIGEQDQSKAFLEQSSKINKKLGDIQGFIRANDSLGKTLLAKAEKILENDPEGNEVTDFSGTLNAALEHAYVSFSEASWYSKIPEQAFAMETFLKAYTLLQETKSEGQDHKAADNRLKEMIERFGGNLQKAESKRIFNREQLDVLAGKISIPLEGQKLRDILENNL